MPPIPPKKQFNWGRFSKGLSFWILVILIPVAVIQFSGSKGEPATSINYSDYRAELDRGNISRATIRAGSTVTGEFTQRVMVQGREVKKFTVKLPMTDSPDEVKELLAKKVVIDAQEARPSVGTFLLNFLPYFVLIAIWIFLFRQIQAGGAKAFSFGKSKAKLLTGDTPKVTFADVSAATRPRSSCRRSSSS